MPLKKSIVIQNVYKLILFFHLDNMTSTLLFVHLSYLIIQKDKFNQFNILKTNLSYISMINDLCYVNSLFIGSLIVDFLFKQLVF